MDDEEIPSIVLDNGSANCRVGFAGDDSPKSVFASAVGRPRGQNISFDSGAKSWHVGDEIKTERGEMVLSCPMEHGIVTDWDDMEKVWHHAFYSQLRTEPQQQPVLLTEAVLNPRSNREKMIEVMFEKFQVPGAYIAPAPQMGVYAYGLSCAISCDSGDGVTQVLPIYDGYCPLNAIQRVDFAGRDLTHSLSRMMQERGHAFSSTAEMGVVSAVKKELCYVAENYDRELLTSQNTCSLQKSYCLPDGSTVTLNDERFRSTEALFNPKLLGLNLRGIHQAMYDCVMGCDIDYHRDLFRTFIVSGANTLIPGLVNRLKKELRYLLPESAKMTVLAAPERAYMTWIGASIMASLNSFEDRWIKKQDYEEYGPEVVHCSGSLRGFKKPYN